MQRAPLKLGYLGICPAISARIAALNDETPDIITVNYTCLLSLALLVLQRHR